MKKVIVLAGNYNEFQRYVLGQADSGLAFVEGCDRHHVAGIRAYSVVTIGTFWDRKDALEMDREAHARIGLWGRRQGG